MTFTKSVPAFLAVALLSMSAMAVEPAKTVHATTPAKTASVTAKPSASAKPHVMASNTTAAKKALQDKCMKQYPNDHAQYLKCAEGTGSATKTN